MQLSKRLRAVAGLVPPMKRVADIGCDHGYMSIFLLREGIAERVIAMDVNAGPLGRAWENIEKYGYADRIETRLSDGADALFPGEAEVLLLSGMGGKLTLSILKRAIERLGALTFVLQPQSEIALVRRTLFAWGYETADEDFVTEDGKCYPMMRMEPGRDLRKRGVILTSEVIPESESPYTKEERFGPVLLGRRPAEFVAYLEKERKKTKELILRVTDEARVRELQTYLEMLGEITGKD